MILSRLPLDTFAASLPRLVEQTDEALAIACRELFHVNDELARHFATSPNDDRRLQRLLQEASDDFEDHARRLLRRLDDWLPRVRFFLQQIEIAPVPVAEPEPEPMMPALASSVPSTIPAPVRRPRVPVSPRERARPVVPAPAAPRPATHSVAPVALVPVSASPIRRLVPSTTEDLRQAWRAAERAWDEARPHFPVDAQVVFDRDHWQPLELELSAMLRQMDELAEVVARIIRELA